MPRLPAILRWKAHKGLRVGCATLGLLGCAGPALAADNVAAPGRAEVILPATLETLENLEFGPIVASGAGGAMTINPTTDAKSAVGSIVIVGTGAHRATFRSQLPVGLIVFFLGDSNVTLTRQGGTETMQASLTYATGSGLVNGPFLGTRRSSATEQFYYAGGTLLIGAGQVPGFYEGTFSLNIDNL